MPIKVVKFKTNQKELFEKARKIRYVVFVAEQNVSEKEEFDNFDDDAVQYLVYHNNNVAGTGRRRITENGHKLERFAVYKEFRGKHIGASLINAMLEDILPTDKNVYLNAQVYAEKFYEKFGFIKEGEVFEEAGINHIKMVYRINKK